MQPKPAPKPNPQPQTTVTLERKYQPSGGGNGGGNWFRVIAVLLGVISLSSAGFLAWNTSIDTIPKGLVFSGLFGFGLAGLANIFSGSAQFSIGKTLRLTGYLAVFVFLVVLAFRAMGLIDDTDDLSNFILYCQNFLFV